MVETVFIGQIFLNSMKSKCLFHIGCLLLLPALQGNAQPDASAAFDSGYVETGNPFALHLSVPEHYGQPDGADFSTWKAQFPSENILSRTGWKRQGGRWVSDYTLIAFDSAQLALPPLRIGLPSGDTLMTNALELQVLPTPAPGDPAQMLGIKAIRREPANLIDYLKPLWPVAAGVLILALAIWWLLYDRKKTGLQAGHPPPHELAFRKLNALQQKQYWQHGSIKTYYSELTHIAREYLEHRYAVPALESPSDEILRGLMRTDIPAPFISALADLLRWADLAKFAKGTPPAHFHEQAFQEVWRLVEQTQLRETFTDLPQPTLHHP